MQKVLTDREVFAIVIDHQKLMTKPKEGSNAIPKAYYRASYDGITFTIDQTFYDQMQNGEVIEVRLTEGERQVPNPLVAGATITKKSLAFGGAVTMKQDLGLATHKHSIKMLDVATVTKVELTDDIVTELQKRLAGTTV